ncbi:MAG: rhomboid family intramembrane serine protease [Bacteroidetes bacterium]|nr:rhomboid family intramembrane serine protease [Bacteroidota bacterium]
MSNPVFAEFKKIFTDNNAVKVFIAANVVVFLAINLVLLAFFLMGISEATIDLTRFLAVPSAIGSFLSRPWTIITYMFLHLGFFHLFFNMLILYIGGRIFTEYLGDKNLISTYFVGGIVGALFYIAAFNLFPGFERMVSASVALGASASVIAILVGAATYVPNYTLNLLLIGPIRLKYIVIFLLVVDLISIRQENPGGHIAHLGGAFYGYIFVSQYKQGRNIALWFNKLADYIATLFKPKSNLKVAYTSKRKTDEEYNVMKAESQQRIDIILDKISKSGYESLTKEEKEFLFNASKNL